MKFSTSTISTSNSQAYTDTDVFSNLPITNSRVQNFSAYLNVLANKRSGYEVTMAATAMTSVISGQENSYINYSVSLVSDSSKIITTDGATATSAITVMDVNSLTALTGASEKLALSVDSTTFSVS